MIIIKYYNIIILEFHDLANNTTFFDLANNTSLNSINNTSVAPYVLAAPAAKPAFPAGVGLLPAEVGQSRRDLQATRPWALLRSAELSAEK